MDYSADGRLSNDPSQAYKFDTNNQSVLLAGNLTSSGGSLTKSGAGTLTLSGTNTYDGATNVNAGTLRVVKTDSLPGYATSQLSVADGAVLAVSVGGPVAWSETDIGNLLSGGANFAATAYFGIDTTDATSGFALLNPLTKAGLNLAKLGDNTLTLTTDNTYTGNTMVNGGTLQFSGGSLAGGNNLYVGNGPGSVATMLMDGTVGTLTFNGGTWTNGCYIGLAGGTGTVTINAGTLSSKDMAGDITLATGLGGGDGSIGTLNVNGGSATCQRLIFPDGGQ